MMQEARWTAEVAIMNQHFPTFAAFKTENGSVGFFGRVRGPRSGREYAVLVKVPAQRSGDGASGLHPAAHHERALVDRRSEPRPRRQTEHLSRKAMGAGK